MRLPRIDFSAQAEARTYKKVALLDHRVRAIVVDSDALAVKSAQECGLEDVILDAHILESECLQFVDSVTADALNRQIQ